MPPPYDLSAIKKLAVKLATEGPVKTIPTSRRIRIKAGGAYIADTHAAKYVWEHPYYPQYYLPKEAFLKSEHVKIESVEDLKTDDGRQIGQRWQVTISDRKLEKVICFSDDLKNPASDLAGYVKVDFYDADKWFEEDTPIFVHPKDPYKRVDLIQSNRAVRVSVDGQKVAEAVTSVHLYETGLPVRFYMPLTAIDPSVLRSSETKTQCPYKGESEYYHVVVNGKEHRDIIWYYDTPTIECAGVAGLCCFYNEKVDIEIMENGNWKKLEKPKSPFA